MTKNLMKTISLSTQLTYTAQMVERVSEGMSLDRCLEVVPTELRAGVKALSYYTMRHLGVARAISDLLLQKPPPASIHALLWVSISLLLVESASTNETEESIHTESDSPSYKPYVLVSQAVEATKKHSKTKNFSALVNGVLRRFMREKDQLLAQVHQSDPSTQWNFQPWWIQRLKKDWPEQWQDILRCAQTPAPMTLRVNAKWATPEVACKYLNEQGIAATVIGSYALELEKPMNVLQIPGFEQGHFSVQSAAAQLAAPLLLDSAWLAGITSAQPLKVLDACCAPGGKTAHLLEIASSNKIEVVAVDSDKERLFKVQQTLDRIGLKAQLRYADLSSHDAFQAEEMFDAILLDAPCSASGIVRRHPDIRWLRRASDIGQLASLQEKIQQALWARLKPGGRLLYSTCSLFKAEGVNQAEKFKLRHNESKQLKAPGHILPLTKKDGVADQGATGYMAADGFYYALFEK